MTLAFFLLFANVAFIFVFIDLYCLCLGVFGCVWVASFCFSNIFSLFLCEYFLFVSLRSGSILFVSRIFFHYLFGVGLNGFFCVGLHSFVSRFFFSLFVWCWFASFFICWAWVFCGEFEFNCNQCVFGFSCK